MSEWHKKMKIVYIPFPWKKNGDTGEVQKENITPTLYVTTWTIYHIFGLLWYNTWMWSQNYPQTTCS